MTAYSAVRPTIAKRHIACLQNPFRNRGWSFISRRLAATFVITLLLTACSSAPPAPSPVARGDFATLCNQLATYIRHEMRQYKLAGLSIALVDDQQIIWADGFGWADVASAIPAGADTRYRIGSISKLLTNTAAMQLVAEHRLDLDAPVENTLPWFRIGSAWADAAPMTLRQLMTHHAGLPRDVAAGMWLREAPSAKQDFRAMLRTLATSQADAPPERMLSYSNIGLDVVGAMIEAASGQPFEQRLQESLLEPLGMHGAQFTAAVPTDATMALGHFNSERQKEPALRDVPAGGMNASVTDLAYFLMMQFNGGRNRHGVVVLPAAQQAAMLQRQYPRLALDAGMRIGLGWMLTTFGTDSVHGGGPVAHHGGATMYFRSQMMMLPEHKLGVVVAANDAAAGMVVNRVAQRALALLLEARSGIHPTPFVPGFQAVAHAWSDGQRQAISSACAGNYMTMAGPVSLQAEPTGLSARLGDRQLEVREGEAGRFGLRYRLAGIIPLNLGSLSEMGFECTQIEGRHVLLAVLDGERMLAGEKLPEPLLPKQVSRWSGRYRPQLGDGEVLSLAAHGEVRIFEAAGRLWAEYQLLPAFGGEKMRVLLQPISETSLRIISPRSDSGPVMRFENDSAEAARFQFSGWTFERVGE